MERARLSNVRCNGWLGLGAQVWAGGVWKFHQVGAMLVAWWVERSVVAGLSCMLGNKDVRVGWERGDGKPGFVVVAQVVRVGAVAGWPSDVAREERWRKGRRGEWCAGLWVGRARGCGR